MSDVLNPHDGFIQKDLELLINANKYIVSNNLDYLNKLVRLYKLIKGKGNIFLDENRELLFLSLMGKLHPH